MEDFGVTIVWLGFFAAVFLGWYFYIKARNKERISLIKQGKDVSDIYKKREIKFRFPLLKLGIIFLGFSLGWIIAFVLTEILINEGFIGRFNNEPLIAGIIFLFTAISILIAYFADRPKSK